MGCCDSWSGPGTGPSCGRGRQSSQGSYMPGEKVGLNRQLGKTLCSPVFPSGLPQPPDSGKRKRAPSVCLPTQPSPNCTSATVPQLFQPSPYIPPHDLGASPLSAPPSPLWATAGPSSWSWPVLGEGLHLGGPLLGHPFLSFSPAHFTAHFQLSLALLVTHQAGDSGQEFGPPFMGTEDLLEAALFSSAPSPPPPFRSCH